MGLLDVKFDKEVQARIDRALNILDRFVSLLERIFGSSRRGK